mmetsp:Transcript_24294/g.70317  ORF Transcript_24294/g.70317 Transcript_24294/m.70317 type:complete len:174 (+) Transcript_24294:93-614(+)
MAHLRSSSTMALPNRAYGPPKGSFYSGVDELERFPPTYPAHHEVFDEYMSNKSMSPSRHLSTLSKSSGLMELHYDTMRKKALQRKGWPTYKELPSMDRAFNATANYSGFIPGKISNNISGCSHRAGSQIAYDTMGATLPPPMSGLHITLGNKTLAKSSSLPSLGRSRGSIGSP